MGVFRQFPYSNFHEMNMDEIIKIVKNMLEEWAQYHAEWDAWMNQMNDDWSNYQEVMNEAWQNMQDFINNYFDNLDVQEEINNKIDALVDSGEFITIVQPYVPPVVRDWLSQNITEPTGVVIDKSLSVEGACADAEATGKAIDYLHNNIGVIAPQDETGTYMVFPLGFLTFLNTADGRIKCTTDELEEGDKVFLTDPVNYQIALSTENGESLYGWFTDPVYITSTRRYIAIRKTDNSNIQQNPSYEFSRVVYVIRKAKYYSNLTKSLSNAVGAGKYLPYQIGELPFHTTGDVRVKCSDIALNPGDVVHLLDTDNYRIGISLQDGGSPYGWFTGPITVTPTRRYVIFKDVNNADISNMWNFDTSKLIYVERDTETQKQLDNATYGYKFAHISFDDVRFCMEDITTNAGTYTSIFDNPFFAKLKTLHENYNAIFSLYLFTENMSSYTTAFADEFTANADWLKFGFHAINGNSNFENTTGAQASTAYNDFVNNIISITGTVETIDRLPRLGNFKGNLESMLAIRDCKCGVVGALSAYDTRDSYYLSSADSAFVKDHGKLYDATHYMTFFRTIMTMEVSNPSTSLPALLTKAEYNNSNYLVAMMHEYEVYTSNYEIVSAMADRIEYACNWAVEHEYDWDYPMHRC